MARAATVGAERVRAVPPARVQDKSHFSMLSHVAVVCQIQPNWKAKQPIDMPPEPPCTMFSAGLGLGTASEEPAMKFWNAVR